MKHNSLQDVAQYLLKAVQEKVLADDDKIEKMIVTVIVILILILIVIVMMMMMTTTTMTMMMTMTMTMAIMTKTTFTRKASGPASTQNLVADAVSGFKG